MAAVAACKSAVIVAASRTSPVAPSSSSESGSSASLALRTSFHGSSLRQGAVVCTRRATTVTIKASSSYPPPEPDTEEINAKAQKFFEDVKIRWDKVEDKPTFLLYTGAAITAIYLSSAVISAFEAVPLVPKLFQLVGIGYSSWFIYRYLLFTPNRQELYSKIDEIKGKIAGESKELSGDLTEARKSVAGDIKPVSNKIDGAVKDAQTEFESLRK